MICAKISSLIKEVAAVSLDVLFSVAFTCERAFKVINLKMDNRFVSVMMENKLLLIL